MFSAKMDRKQIILSNKEKLDSRDAEYWKSAAVEEKLQTITFLRECFYGEKATTGRVPRICTVLKLK